MTKQRWELLQFFRVNSLCVVTFVHACKYFSMTSLFVTKVLRLKYNKSSLVPLILAGAQLLFQKLPQDLKENGSLEIIFYITTENYGNYKTFVENRRKREFSPPKLMETAKSCGHFCFSNWTAVILTIVSTGYFSKGMPAAMFQRHCAHVILKIQIHISQSKAKMVSHQQPTLPKVQFLPHLACNQKQLNTAGGVHAQNKADHFTHHRNCSVCWKRSTCGKHSWLRRCLFRLWFSFINKSTQFGQALHVLINNHNIWERSNLFNAPAIPDPVKKPVVLPTLNKQNTVYLPEDQCATIPM